MKELIVGDVSVCSEDGDSWESLLEVAKKAKKIYVEILKELNMEKSDPKVIQAIRKVFS